MNVCGLDGVRKNRKEVIIREEVIIRAKKLNNYFPNNIISEMISMEGRLRLTKYLSQIAKMFVEDIAPKNLQEGGDSTFI